MALKDCKGRVLKRLEKVKFQEIGGYLLGHFDGTNIRIRYFLLDDHSMSSSTRIKLSSEAFEEVESIQAAFPSFSLLHIGDWHVHPGDEKPSYSEVDIATLFLERFQINTDNPEGVMAPKIHLIFSESLAEMSIYIMTLDMDTKLIPLIQTDFQDEFKLPLLRDSTVLLKDVIKLSEKPESVSKYESIRLKLETIYDNTEELLEQSYVIQQCFEDLEWYKEYQADLMSVIKKSLENNVKMGVLVEEKKGKVYLQNYRPKNIQNAHDSQKLIGFWKFFPYDSVDPSFHSIFLANFITHLDEVSIITRYFAVYGSKTSFKILPYFVFMRAPEKIKFEELTPHTW